MGFSSWLLWLSPPFLIPSISSAPQLLPDNSVLSTSKCTFPPLLTHPLKLSRRDRTAGRQGVWGERKGVLMVADSGLMTLACFAVALDTLRGTFIRVHVIPFIPIQT